MPAAVEHLDQLIDLDLTLARRAAMKSIGNAMPEVIAKRLLLDLVESCARCPDLV